MKLYFEDYQRVMFCEELDKVKFSLCDQYSCNYNSFNNIKDSILLIEESKHKNFLLN